MRAQTWIIWPRTLRGGALALFAAAVLLGGCSAERGSGEGDARKPGEHFGNRVGVSAIPGNRGLRESFRVHPEAGSGLGIAREARASAGGAGGTRAGAADPRGRSG